jgi:4-amino-4-deoxy-L-arabinose transferase-like glycosyltransferase
MTTNSGVLPRAAVPRLSLRRGPSAPDTQRRTVALDRERAALLLLLALTAVAYVWDLSASGYANSFYAAAVQAGTKSWKALFFGSIDSSNFITVDKPPASLWVMALSGRIFGFDSMSMLVPQVLEGVAAVALLSASIRRWFGARAGLAAGALLALTPVAALMFHFNNPDALLVLALVAGAYCLTRALERAGTRWVLAAGTMIGFAFLAKMMQAFLVLPAFALVYLLAAPTGLRRRMLQTLAGGAAILVSAGWWVAIVALWPAGSRPMIDGSSTNSVINLILGYNGLGRIFGASGPGGGGGGANFSGSTGVLRLFNSVMGGQASWLLPTALLALVVGLAATRRAQRTDRTRAALVLWGGWLVISGLVFSLGSGIIHTYYTVALAPAIAALVAIGGRMLWDRRESRAARLLATATVALTAAWAYILLARTPSWQPWLRTLVLVSGSLATAGLLALAVRPGTVPARRMRAGVAVLAAVSCLVGPAAYTLQTLQTAHTGSTPSAGPAVAGGGFAGGAGFGGASRRPGTLVSGRGLSTGGPPAGASGAPGSAPRSAGGPGGEQVTVSAALKAALTTGSAGYRWAAATSGSQSAASLELATGGAPVMAIGGFNNQAKVLTLAQFETYVSQHSIHYYVASGSGAGGGPGAGGSSDIATWVAAHFTKVTIGGQVLYDLSSATA